MYYKIVDEDPYKTPMMIYPAVHYTMGGTWVDYNLQTTIPGCFYWRIKLLRSRSKQIRASLMQGLADGYFVLPYTIGDYLSPDIKMGPILILQSLRRQKRSQEQIEKFMNNNGTHSVDYFHRKLGK
jgi:succinate dehydrogenase / fumarate reductase flavoprotein subunit